MLDWQGAWLWKVPLSPARIVISCMGPFAQSARNAVAPWISFWSPQTLKISCLPPFAVDNAVFWIAGKSNQIFRFRSVRASHHRRLEQELSNGKLLLGRSRGPQTRYVECGAIIGFAKGPNGVA
jgi:hypothetical protein